MCLSLLSLGLKYYICQGFDDNVGELEERFELLEVYCVFDDERIDFLGDCRYVGVDFCVFFKFEQEFEL